MKPEQEHTQSETIRVAAPVADAGLNVCSEVMHALPDPADPDQAILVNVPVLADGINFGDLVRLEPEDDFGVRRIEAVVVPSGHVHLLTAVEDGEAPDLVAELERMFPSYALKVEAMSATIVSVSVHPHLDAGDVTSVIASWLGFEQDEDPFELPIGEPEGSEVGRISWA